MQLTFDKEEIKKIIGKYVLGLYSDEYGDGVIKNMDIKLDYCDECVIDITLKENQFPDEFFTPPSEE